MVKQASTSSFIWEVPIYSIMEMRFCLFSKINTIKKLLFIAKIIVTNNSKINEIIKNYNF